MNNQYIEMFCGSVKGYVRVYHFYVDKHDTPFAVIYNPNAEYSYLRWETVRVDDLIPPDFVVK